MLDFDLAEIYGIENKYLKRSVRSNIERFEGDDFMFELTRDELSRCNFSTLNKGCGSNVNTSVSCFQFNWVLMDGYLTVFSEVVLKPQKLRPANFP